MSATSVRVAVRMNVDPPDHAVGVDDRDGGKGHGVGAVLVRPRHVDAHPPDFSPLSECEVAHPSHWRSGCSCTIGSVKHHEAGRGGLRSSPWVDRIVRFRRADRDEPDIAIVQRRHRVLRVSAQGEGLHTGTTRRGVETITAAGGFAPDCAVRRDDRFAVHDRPRLESGTTSLTQAAPGRTIALRRPPVSAPPGQVGSRISAGIWEVASTAWATRSPIVMSGVADASLLSPGFFLIYYI